MTTAEATTLLVDLVCEVSAVRRELSETCLDRNAYQLLSQQAIQYVAELTRQLEMVDRRLYVYRRHAKDRERAREAHEATA